MSCTTEKTDIGCSSKGVIFGDDMRILGMREESERCRFYSHGLYPFQDRIPIEESFNGPNMPE